MQAFMHFTKLFQKSNSSIYQLQGCVLDCSIEQIRGNKIIVDTGMRSSFVCSEDELSQAPSVVVRIAGFPAESGSLNSKNSKSTNKHKVLRTLRGRGLAQATSFKPLLPKGQPRVGDSKQNLKSTKYASFGLNRIPFFGIKNSSITTLKSTCIIGIEEKRSAQSGEFACTTPKSIEKLSRRKLIWTELTKLWRTSSKNRVKGFILNSVNGGYAVALAGYIAFLPKSLCLNKKVFIGQWRQFAIISMNPKIANIVVKEIKTNFPGLAKNKSKVKINRSKKTRQNNRPM
jgi:hypothetical protein